MDDTQNATELAAAEGRSRGGVTYAAAGLAVLIAASLFLHARGFNGPAYFPWAWQRCASGPSLLIAGLFAGQAVVATWATRPGARTATALLTLTIASVGLRLGVSSALSDPPGLDFARAMVCAPTVGSFFPFAQALRSADWTLVDYPELMHTPGVPLHIVNKPPGPMMFWYALLRPGVDADRAATLGIVLVAVFSALAIPLTAACTRSAGSDARSARHAAAMMSLAPGAVAFFPLFDPAYTTFTLAILTLWFTSLRRDSILLAAAAGLTASGLAFVAFHVAPVALFALAAAVAAVDGRAGARVTRVVRNAIAAALAAVAGVVLMKMVSGYDALATFAAALDGQRALVARFGSAHRPYPQTIPWDLYDFALGVGFVPVLLCIGSFARPRDGRREVAFAGCALGTLGVIAVAAWLPGETARVWNFLFPLVAIPAAARLRDASTRHAAIVYASLALVGVALLTNLRFMGFADVITK